MYLALSLIQLQNVCMGFPVVTVPPVWGLTLYLVPQMPSIDAAPSTLCDLDVYILTPASNKADHDLQFAISGTTCCIGEIIFGSSVTICM